MTRLAKAHGKPVIAFSGAVREGAEACNEAGIDAYFPILRRLESPELAMHPEHAGRNLADTAEQVFRLMKTIS